MARLGQKSEPGTIVSMNLWDLQGILSELETGFPAFLRQALKENPLKGEYLLPRIVNDLVRDNKATVEVLHSRINGRHYLQGRSACCCRSYSSYAGRGQISRSPFLVYGNSYP